jgi:hypothetical protein
VEKRKNKMALEKRTVEDKIEIVGDYKHIQVRTATQIVEDGTVISSSFHRHVVAPGDDITSQSAEVQAIANAVWTDEIIAAYQASQA